MKKILILAAGLFLTGIACKAASKKSGIEVVIRGTEGGPWHAYIFGPVCAGKLEAVPAKSVNDPIEVVCR